MDELIVRVSRGAACVTRLRILARLAGGEELTLSRLAGDLRLRRDLVCTHLARLTAVGLVRRRRSGRRCYCIAGSPYGPDTISGQVASWLGAALRAHRASLDATRLPKRGRRRAVGGLPQVYGALLDAATAFTHPRRIQALRLIASRTLTASGESARELRMSAPALSRHVAKLVRRGYVSASRVGHRLSCQLAVTTKTLYHARLLEIVRRHWDEQGPSA